MELLRNFKGCQQYLRIKLHDYGVELKFFHGAQDHRHIHIELEAVLPDGKIKHSKYVCDISHYEDLDEVFRQAIDTLLESVLVELEDEE